MKEQTDRHGNPKSKLKTALESIVKWFSAIALVVSIIVMAILYFGPEIQLNTSIVVGLAVPSIILAFSISIVYTMWLSNGQQSASKDPEYKTEVNRFMTKSEHLHYPTLQECLDYEELRRYDVEYDRLKRLIQREEALLEKMKKSVVIENEYRLRLSKFKRLFAKRSTLDKLRIKWTKRRIKKWTKLQDTIRIRLPYTKSEEFDYLRYNTQDTNYKEHSPNDTRKHLRTAKLKKYINTFTFTLIGFNIVSMGATYQSTWTAVIMTLLAVVTLVLACVQGFIVGYKNISVISRGVYKTANSYLDRAVAHCTQIGKNLYYVGDNQFKELVVDIESELPRLDGTELYQDELMMEKNIFTKAAYEVTKTNNLGI